MDYADLLSQVDERWRSDFSRFLDDQESSPEFEDQLNNDPDLQRLMDTAIERKVPPKDIRLAFWSEISRVNRSVSETLRDAIAKRIESSTATRPPRSAPVTAHKHSSAVEVLERDIEELGTGIQSARSAEQQRAKSPATGLDETIERIADSVVSLAIAKVGG